MSSDYKPIVMTKDGVYQRDEGLIVPSVGTKKPIKKLRVPGDPISRGEPEEEQEEEKQVVSRKDCVTTARKEK